MQSCCKSVVVRTEEPDVKPHHQTVAGVGAGSRPRTGVSGCQAAWGVGGRRDPFQQEMTSEKVSPISQVTNTQF